MPPGWYDPKTAKEGMVHGVPLTRRRRSRRRAGCRATCRVRPGVLAEDADGHLCRRRPRRTAYRLYRAAPDRRQGAGRYDRIKALEPRRIDGLPAVLEPRRRAG